MKESLVGGVGRVALVVELDVVEVDCLAYLGVHGYVCAVLVMLFFEVWGLWRMGYYMAGQKLTETGLELDKPLFSLACLHCCIVLPIYINSIQVILKHKITQFLCTIDRVITLGSWIFSRSESTDHNLNPFLIILRLKGSLHLPLTLPKTRLAAKKPYRIGPNGRNIKCPTPIGPKCKDQIVIECRFGIAGDTHPCGNPFRGPPLVYTVDVG